jgi:hypothetical protein
MRGIRNPGRCTCLKLPIILWMEKWPLPKAVDAKEVAIGVVVISVPMPPIGVDNIKPHPGMTLA